MAGTNQALRTGWALAVTVGVGYASCALFFLLLPATAMSLMNSLFHGLDFSKIQAGAVPFNFAGFGAVLVILMVWALILGTIFGWLRGWREAA